MVTNKYLSVAFALLGGGLFLVACDNGQQQTQKSNSAKSTSDDDDEVGGEDDEQNNSAGSTTGDFDEWCKIAEEVEVVEDKLSELFDKMCNNGKATSLMKSTMITKAYSGSGSPKLTNIEPISGDKKYSTAFFAVGIKIPIDIKTHFDQVGPRAGDAEAQIKLAEEQGAKAEFEIQDTFKKDGKYHVRGWKTHSKQTKKTPLINIVTESISRVDQFEFQSGSLYMYTQYVVEGIEGVENFSLLTAGVKTSKGSYLLTTAKVKVGNKGFPDMAKGQITDTAKALVKSMYNAATDD